MMWLKVGNFGFEGRDRERVHPAVLQRVYKEYCNKADPNDMMKRMMEEVIPQS